MSFLWICFIPRSTESPLGGGAKGTDFKPEHAGQFNFYLAAVDAQIKAKDDKPTIGLLLTNHYMKRPMFELDRIESAGVADYVKEAVNYRLRQSL